LSEFLRHEPCPKCNSRDNLARYTDGHAYCFSCEYYEHADGTVSDKETSRMPTGLIKFEVAPLQRRGINEDTCKKWGYGVGEYQGRPVQVANYCDAQGNPVAQKLRFQDKTFKWLGEPKKAGLFGVHLWRDSGKMVTITEGEIDALTLSGLSYPYQMGRSQRLKLLLKILSG